MPRQAASNESGGYPGLTCIFHHDPGEKCGLNSVLPVMLTPREEMSACGNFEVSYT